MEDIAFVDMELLQGMREACGGNGMDYWSLADICVGGASTN